MKKSHRSEFLREVKDLFPQLTPELNNQTGLLSFEIEVVVRFLQTQIDQGERKTTERCFELLNFHFLNGNLSLRNLIQGAICEDLILENSTKRSREWVLRLMPQELKEERQKWFGFMRWGDRV